MGHWPLRAKAAANFKKARQQILLASTQPSAAKDVLQRLDKAYQAFFKKLTKYPKFKRKGKYNSFTYPQYGNGWEIKNNNKLVLSHIGAIDFKMHRMTYLLVHAKEMYNN